MNKDVVYSPKVYHVLQIIEAHDGMAHPDVVNVIDHLHQTLESQGKSNELGRLYSRLASLEATDLHGQAVLTKVMASCNRAVGVNLTLWHQRIQGVAWPSGAWLLPPLNVALWVNV